MLYNLAFTQFFGCTFGCNRVLDKIGMRVQLKRHGYPIPNDYNNFSLIM